MYIHTTNSVRHNFSAATNLALWLPKTNKAYLLISDNNTYGTKMYRIVLIVLPINYVKVLITRSSADAEIVQHASHWMLP